MRLPDLRRYLFAALAILNLAFWLGLAGLAGLLLSDRVDLGLETLLRQGQATAVAAWERQIDTASPTGAVRAVAVAPGLPAATDTVAAASATPSPLPHVSIPSPTPPSGPLAGPTYPSASPSRPASAGSPTPINISAPAGPTRLPTWTVVAGAGPSQPAAHDTPAPWPVLPDVASAPTRALSSAPLLLADPAFADLSQLNAEMERSAPGRPVQIRYQEAALNREIVTLLSGNPTLPYRDVLVDLKRDRLVVTGKVSLLGFHVNASAEGMIVARDCRPQFEIESVSVASIVTPGFVKARVAEMLQEAMAWYPADYPLCIEQIVLEEAMASIYGTRR
jgi:hypothetical protein